MSRAAWEEGSFDPLSLGRTPSCAPLQLGWLASFPGLCLKWPSSCLGLPEPAKVKTKFGVKFRSKFRLARRIESNQIGSGSGRTEGTLFRPFFDPLSV